jgi:hypothetical protein
MSYDFEASSSHRGIISSSIITAYGWSVAFWFKPESQTTSDCVFSLQHTGGDGLPLALIRINASNQLECFRRTTSNSATVAGPATTLSNGTWYHACFVETGQSSRALYVNGTAGTTDTTDMVSWSASQDLDWLGLACRALTPSNFFDGKIGYAAVWNTALSGANVSSLYNGGAGALPTTVGSPIAYWPLTADATDNVGAYDWTITGAALSSPADDPFSAATAHALVQSGAIGVTGAIAVLGDITAQGQFWRVPTNAGGGQSVHVIVYSGTSPTYSILAQGTATVAGGYAQIPATTGTAGDKAFAFVHNYSDNTATTSIYGGPGIATRYTGV